MLNEINYAKTYSVAIRAVTAPEIGLAMQVMTAQVIARVLIEQMAIAMSEIGPVAAIDLVVAVALVIHAMLVLMAAAITLAAVMVALEAAVVSAVAVNCPYPLNRYKQI